MKRPILAEVRLKKNETFERMVKRFLKKVKKEKIIEKFLEKKQFTKNSVLKRKKKMARKRMLDELKNKGA